MRSTILSLLATPSAGKTQPHAQSKRRSQQQQQQQQAKKATFAAKPHHPSFATPDFISAIINLRQKHTPRTRKAQYCAPGFLNVNVGTAVGADEQEWRVPELIESPVTVRDSATQTDDWSDSGYKRLLSNMELARHLCEGLMGNTCGGDEGSSSSQQAQINWRVFHEKVYAGLMEESWRVDALRKELATKARYLDATLVSASADQARMRSLSQENALLRQHVGTIGAENARLAVLLHDATLLAAASHRRRCEEEAEAGEELGQLLGLFHLPVDALFD